MPEIRLSKTHGKIQARAAVCSLWNTFVLHIGQDASKCGTEVVWNNVSDDFKSKFVEIVFPVCS